MNTKLYKVAFSNVLKHKRRSFFNLMTFAMNMLGLVLLIGLLRGSYNMMFDKSVDLSTGHLKIYQKSYMEEKKKMPLDINVPSPDKVIAAIKGAPGFKAASPRIVRSVTISNMKDKTSVVLYGIRFKEEKNILAVYNKIEGAPLEAGGAGVLVGKRLSDLMQVKEGTGLLLYGMTRYNSNNLVDSYASGIYSAGFAFLERNVIYADYAYVSRFLDMDGAASEIIIRLNSRADVPAAKKYMASVLKEKYPGLTVRDWMEEAPGLIDAALQDMVSYGILFGIMLFLAVFIIINTLTISVYERIPEIGTLRAIGFQKEQIKSMFFSEGMILAGMGVIAGAILVLPLAYWLNVHGIEVKLDEKSLASINMPFDPVMKAKNMWVDWIIGAIVCFMAGAIGASFPSNKASKINIVTALKRGAR